MIITIGDIRAAGICVAGAKTWFKSQGFDFADFLKNGISAETLLATGDPLALRVVHLKQGNDGQK